MDIIYTNNNLNNVLLTYEAYYEYMLNIYISNGLIYTSHHQKAIYILILWFCHNLNTTPYC